MRFLRSFDAFLARCELFLGVAAMTGLVLLLVGQVIFRYGLQSPLFFAEEVALVLLVIATFAGLSLLVYERKLISVNVAALWFSKSVMGWVTWMIQWLLLVLAVCMVVFAIRYLSTPWVWIERSATLNVPRAVIYAIVAAEIAFLAFHQAVICVGLAPPWSRRETEQQA